MDVLARLCHFLNVSQGESLFDLFALLVSQTIETPLSPNTTSDSGNSAQDGAGGWAMTDEALLWARSTVWSRAFNVPYLGACILSPVCHAVLRKYAVRTPIAPCGPLRRIRASVPGIIRCPAFGVLIQGPLGEKGLPWCLLLTCWTTVTTATWPGTQEHPARIPSPSSVTPPSVRQGTILTLVSTGQRFSSVPDVAPRRLAPVA